MSTAARLLTPQEYLTAERRAETRSEFYDGQVVAMAGGTNPHSAIIANLTARLVIALEDRSCITHTSDMRVKAGPNYVYPDVSVTCGTPRFEDDREDTLLNPSAIFEVLSPSTELLDRGAKGAEYRRLKSLRALVLVAQDRPHIELYTRESGGRWRKSELTSLDANLVLAAIDVTIPLKQIYHRVEWSRLRAARS